MSDKKEILSLTGLRFLAALSVAMAHGSSLIFHVEYDKPLLLTWLPRGAAFGMTLFFVLSGFVIHYNYRTIVTAQGLNGIAAFIWARFSRLYPLFFMMLVIGILLENNFLHFLINGPNLFGEELRALPYFLLFVQSWFYVPLDTQSLIYSIGRSVPLTWSISTEWFFYLAFPFAAPLILRFRRPSSVFVAAVGWSIVWITLICMLDAISPHIEAWAVETYGPMAAAKDNFADSHQRWLFYFSPYIRIGEFILGCLIAQLYLTLRDRPVTPRERLWGVRLQMVSLVVVPLTIILMYAERVHIPLLLSTRMNFGLAPSIGLLIFCSARYDSWFSRLMSTRSMVALGDASYAIYLIHILVFFAVASGEPSLPGTPINMAVMTARFVMCLGLILLISQGVHTHFEVPARNRLRSLWSPKRAGGQDTGRRLWAWSLLASPAFAAIAIVLGLNWSQSTELVANGITITAATYGANCGADRGNVTNDIGKSCNGHKQCSYTINVNQIGDPAPGCGKSYKVEYRCTMGPAMYSREVPGEAGLGSVVELSCPVPDSVSK